MRAPSSASNPSTPVTASAYWQALFDTEPAELPTDHPRVGSVEGSCAQVSVPLDIARLDRLKAAAPVSAVLLAGLSALVCRYTDQPEIVLGFNATGTGTSKVPVRIAVDLDQHFSALHTAVLAAVAEARAQGDEPEELGQALDAHRRSQPLFRLAVDATAEGGTGMYGVDITLRIDGNRCVLEYRTDLFWPATARRFAEHLARLLDNAAEEPQRPVGRLALLSAKERNLVLGEMSRSTATPRLNGCFDQIFRAQVARMPDAPAVCDSQGNISYTELDQSVTGLVRRLRRLAPEAGQDTVIGVALPRGTGFITALLASFRAGCAFVPLDLRQPAELHVRMLTQADSPLVITDREHAPALAQALAGQPTQPTLLLIDELRVEPPVPDEEHIACCTPDSLAYVMFTSGSTGAPKGTMVEQRGMVNHIDGKLQDLGISAGDVVAQIGPPCFDIVVWQCLAVLAVGGRVEVFADEVVTDPARLLAEVARTGVSVLQLVPALLRSLVLVAVEDPVPLPALRWMVPTGDALPTDLCRDWFALYPAIPVLNTYGSTECSDDQCHYRLDAVTADRPAIVPIGRPIVQMAAYILDRHLEPAPIGAVGELYIGGVGVGRGYLGRPDLTDRHFVPDPFDTHPGARLYRTGDRARRRADGSLEFLGRLDFTVKIRGFRIEVDQIEDAVRSHALVHDCVVVARGDGTDRLLVAYVVPVPGRRSAAEGLAEELRERLRATLPTHMVPALFHALDVFPVNGSGKVDRSKLPDPLVPSPAASAAGPANELESTILSLWREVLPVPAAGVTDRFLDLGGHSLLAVELSIRASKLLGVRLSARDLFRYATVKALAEALRTGAVAAHEDGLQLPAMRTQPHDRGKPFALTSLQQAYWVGESSHFELGGLNAHLATELDWPDFDREAAEEAINTLVSRHGVLRTVIGPDGRQRVLSDVPAYRISMVDARGWEQTRLDRELGLNREEFATHGPATDQWPLFEVRAHQLGERDFRVSLRISLLLLDAHSEALLAGEFFERYRNPTNSAVTSAPGYRDHVLALTEIEGSAVHKRAADYWRARMPLPGGPELPLALQPEEVTSPRFTRRTFRLEPDRWEALKARAAAAGLTPSGVLCAAYADVISHWSKNQHFCLNVLTSMRRRLAQDDEKLAANLGSTVPLEVDTRTPSTFAMRAARLQDRLWEDLEHAHFSAVELTRESARETGWTGRAALPVVFASTLDVDNRWLNGLPAGLREVNGALQTPQVFLDHQVYEYGGALVGNWDVVEELFPDGLIDEAFACYRRYVDALADGAQAWDQGLAVVLQTASIPDSTGREPLTLDANGLLHTAFFEIAARQPERIAVVTAQRTITYGELAGHAGAVASWLVDQGIRRGTLIPVVMEKGWEQLAAVLGVLLAGGAYVPVDAALPAARIEYLVEQAGAEVLLAQAWTVPLCAQARQLRVLAVDATGPAAGPTDPLGAFAGRGAQPEDLAYVIYTSGSTGLPKGVAIDHRSAVNTIADINQRFNVGADDRVLALSSLSFDLSVYDVFGLLAVGGSVVLPASDQLREPAAWLELMSRHYVTVWNSVPALMNMLVEYLRTARTDHQVPVRLVMLSGDWIPVTLPNRIRSVLAPKDLVSLGGATEASIWSIMYPIEEVPEHWPSIPYGYSMSGQSVMVLDDQLEPRPIWTTGELYIGGLGVARGYWRDEKRTAQSFVYHPRSGERLYRTGDLGRLLPDGTIEFLGRQDSQVKINGYRIELGEIEAALLRHPAVRGASVTAGGGVADGRVLAAYLVPMEGAVVEPAALRQHLGEALPSYMVPTTYTVLDALPLTGNGKVDRAALPSPGSDRVAPHRAYVQEGPVDELETDLASIWAELLGLPAIGLDEDFFELGGNSFAAVRVIGRIRERFGVELPLVALFRGATVEKLAMAIRDDGAATPRSPLVAIQSGGRAVPLVLVHPVGGNVLCYGELARLLGADQPVFGLVSAGLDRAVKPAESVPQMATAYVDAVLAQFPDGAVRLGGWSMGGVIALEMARQLRERGFTPLPILMIDSYLPDQRDPSDVDEATLRSWFLTDLVKSGVRRPAIGDIDTEFGAQGALNELSELGKNGDSALPGFDEASIEPLFEVFCANNRALSNHRPRYQPDEVVLLRADEGQIGRKADEALGWGSVVDAVRVHRMPGDHFSIFAQPALGLMAEILGGELASRVLG